MAIAFPALPYPIDALAPHVSARTLEFHHGKHHRAYVDNLNKLIAGTDYAELSLQEIVARSRAASDTAIFNNAAQAWNHGFLWHSMSPDGGDAPAGALGQALTEAFGNLGDFRQQFAAAAASQFGSGWVWLVRNRDGLAIEKTANADTPLTGDSTPLLTLDVWEHAYYLDYQNARAGYTEAFLTNLINWDFAAANFETA